MATKSNTKAANVNAGVKAILSNSEGRFDSYRELGRDAAKGKLRAMQLFQKDIADGNLNLDDASNAVAAYALGQKDVNGVGLSETSQKAMTSTFKKFGHPDVIKNAAAVNKMVSIVSTNPKFSKAKTGKDAFAVAYALASKIANRKEGEAIPAIDEKFLAAAVAKKGGNRATKAKDPRADAIASIDNALGVLAVKKNKARQEALAAFKRAFGIELHFWA